MTNHQQMIRTSAELADVCLEVLTPTSIDQMLILLDQFQESLALTPEAHKIGYNIDEAAAAIGVSRRQVYYLMQDGTLPYSTRSGRRLIHADALQALLR